MTAGRTLGLLLVAALLLLGYRLGVEPVGRNSEKRCHEVSATMFETGNWLVPYYDGEPRLQKPPLYYWLSATVAETLGGHSLLATRLPSAIAAGLLLFLVYFWAAAMRGPAFGMLAAALLALSFQFATSGRRGDAEMWLALSSTAALASFERFLATRREGFGHAFLLACTVAFLAKATVIFFTIAIPIAVYLWLERRTITIERRPWLIRLFGAIALGALWYVVLLLRVDHAATYLFGDLVRPLGIDVGPQDGDAAHIREPWYYFDKLPSVTFPIAILLPLVIVRSWKNRLLRDDRPLGFVAVVFLTEFVLFSILPQKQKHYLLPSVPLFAILAAEAAQSFYARPWFQRAVRIATGILVLGGVGVIAFLGSFLRQIDPQPSIGAAWLALAAIGILLAAIGAWRANPRVWLLAVVLAEVGVMNVYRGHIEPWEQHLDDLADEDLPDPVRRDEMLALAKEHPKMIRLLGADGEIEDLEEAKRNETNQLPAK